MTASARQLMLNMTASARQHGLPRISISRRSAMKGKTISAAQLVRAGACKSQVTLFRSIFGPRPVAVTVKLARAHADKFSWNWASQNLLTASASAEYDRACASALAEYNRVRASASAEYDRACASAWADYTRACASASAEYDRACASAW